MDKESIQEKLHGLLADDRRRSQTARLRDVFDDVEKTLASGISYGDVLDTLNQNGFAFTLNGLKTAVRRIRAASAARRGATPSRQQEVMHGTTQVAKPVAAPSSSAAPTRTVLSTALERDRRAGQYFGGDPGHIDLDALFPQATKKDSP